ncbi:acylphosphatase [Methanotorris igneus]|uniref:acylphosphatase n=1 Tax=Methanotorris igneus (strain DSM 5666 / JCM 11834 / Kol 5) TaxID=880724 RepID=F6BC81_METIK|nr:acylphosphatase [Methanotorris igneus]AEF97287.1 acylphosphatase [Methanotorris igneus Kol 5]
MTSTYELIIYGKVQHVGFRDRIENLGHALGIDGVIYNHKDGTVRILVNFDDEEIKEMFKKNIKLLEKKDKLITIEKIEERELKTYIEFPEGINRISADDLTELNKKLDEGVRYIKLIFGELKNINKKLDVLFEIKNTQLEMVEMLKQINNTLEKIEKKL